MGLLFPGHSVLMEVLRRWFGIEGNALGWLAEYLRDDSQVIRVGEMELDGSPLTFGVSQRSVCPWPNTIHRIRRGRK